MKTRDFQTTQISGRSADSGAPRPMLLGVLLLGNLGNIGRIPGRTLRSIVPYTLRSAAPGVSPPPSPLTFRARCVSSKRTCFWA